VAGKSFHYHNDFGITHGMEEILHSWQRAGTRAQLAVVLEGDSSLPGKEPGQPLNDKAIRICSSLRMSITDSSLAQE
jgi:hypothetical protein